eukprot:1863046-Pyramimonas_sp.AAC.1
MSRQSLGMRACAWTISSEPGPRRCRGWWVRRVGTSFPVPSCTTMLRYVAGGFNDRLEGPSIHVDMMEYAV